MMNGELPTVSDIVKKFGGSRKNGKKSKPPIPLPKPIPRGHDRQTHLSDSVSHVPVQQYVSELSGSRELFDGLQVPALLRADSVSHTKTPSFSLETRTNTKHKFDALVVREKLLNHYLHRGTDHCHMVQCDHCGFRRGIRGDEIQVCVCCENPRSSRWMKLQVNKLMLAGEDMTTDQNRDQRKRTRYSIDEFDIFRCKNAKESNYTLTKLIKESHKLKNSTYLVHLMMLVCDLPTTVHSEMFISLVKDSTVTTCLDVTKANVEALVKECPVCLVVHAKDMMVNMVHCNDAVCHACFIEHYTLVIREKSVKNFNCLVCGEPNVMSLSDEEPYLHKLGNLVQLYMSEKLHSLYEQKTTTHVMMKNANFRWCIKCPKGFIAPAHCRLMVECPNPDCRQQMCSQCNKLWKVQHYSMTCEQFTIWNKSNYPAAQNMDAYFNDETLKCPLCGLHYDRIVDGCMHLRCYQCPAEFCSGCSELFLKNCTQYETCNGKGIHAHHPRNCLFYLRDECIDNLKKLLADNNVVFETKSNTKLMCYNTVESQCPVVIEHNEICGITVERGQAGLCQKHYREYLVFKVNEKYIDPLPLFNNISKLSAILLRNGKSVPLQMDGETKGHYQLRLQHHIKEVLPLKKIKGNMFSHSRACKETRELNHEEKRALQVDHEENERITQKMIATMVANGEAMYCYCGMVCKRESGSDSFYYCFCGKKLRWPKRKKT